jgi:hypothetical protein
VFGIVAVVLPAALGLFAAIDVVMPEHEIAIASPKANAF